MSENHPKRTKPVVNDSRVDVRVWIFTTISTFVAVTVCSMLHFAVDFVDQYCRRWLRWKPTSAEDLIRTDQKILASLPCVKEQNMVDVGNNQLWSITCNPQGKGTPMVLVHGMGGGVGLWSLNLDALCKNRPVFAFDLLGFGRSSRPNFSTDPEEAESMFVNSIEEYRRQIGLDKFILLGHSLGGYLCTSYSLQYPQHVKHLILVDPWGMSERPANGRRAIPLPIRVIFSILSPFNPMAAVRGFGPWGPKIVKRYRPGLAKIFASKWGDEQLLHDYIYHCNAQTPSGEIGFKSLTWNMGWAVRPMIHRISDMPREIPITFIYGSRSWIDRNTGWSIKHLRTDSYVDIQVLRGAGHHVYADRFDLFNTLVETIANSVDKGQHPSLDVKLVRRIHDLPSSINLDNLGLDFEQVPGHGDENVDNADEEAKDGESVKWNCGNEEDSEKKTF